MAGNHQLAKADRCHAPTQPHSHTATTRLKRWGGATKDKRQKKPLPHCISDVNAVHVNFLLGYQKPKPHQIEILNTFWSKGLRGNGKKWQENSEKR